MGTIKSGVYGSPKMSARPLRPIIRLAKLQPKHQKPLDSATLHFRDRSKGGRLANTAQRFTWAINWPRQSDLRSRKRGSRFGLSAFRNVPEHFARSSPCVDPRQTPRLVGSKERHVGNLTEMLRNKPNALFRSHPIAMIEPGEIYRP